MDYPFLKSNHYKTIRTLLDSRKDFVVLGLCGKTGSGSTTIANILQTSFNQLNLPQPGSSLGNEVEDYEYRILYTYAQKHWRPFFRIKSSALITAHILNNTADDFLKFFEQLFPDQLHGEDRDMLRAVAENFFETEMRFSLDQEFQLDPNDRKNLSTWFAADKAPVDMDGKSEYCFTPIVRKKSFLTNNEKDEFVKAQLTLGDTEGYQDTINYRYLKDTFTVFFKAKDLYRIFKEYKRLRAQKTGFKNPLWICLLQQFIFEHLPRYAAMLWKNIAKIEHGLEVIALQQLGNNLRISGTPYGQSFEPDGYSTIVADINYSIKLLSAYLVWRKKWAAGLQEKDRDAYLADKRSLIVVDCIKNPFESMYLKNRYTNYYLLGIYTEDHTRHDRLQENQRYPKLHIEAIDIIEQQSAFKKTWQNASRVHQEIQHHAIDLHLSGVARFLQSCKESENVRTLNDRNNSNLPLTQKIDTFLDSYQVFSKSVFQTPADLIQQINAANYLLEQIPQNLKNASDDVRQWNSNYVSVLRESEILLENNVIPEIVLKMMCNIKNLQLYDEMPVIFQNIEGCLQDADIFINNETDNGQYILLKKKIIRYVSLIMNPGLVLPTPVERCMQIAYAAKLNSGCISRQVGAVITDAEYHLLSIGWNQQPEDQLPCSYRDLCSLYYHWSPIAYSDFECDSQEQLQEKIEKPVTELLSHPECPLNIQGKLPAYCFKDLYNSITGSNNQVHPRALHGEETALLNLGQRSAKGGNLFTTSSPCELCAKKAKYLGIRKIYYIEPYAGLSFKHVLNIGPSESRPQMLLFTGAVGRAYTQLYTPLIPQKDELAFWLGAKLDVNLLRNIASKTTSNAQTTIKEEENPTRCKTELPLNQGGIRDDNPARFPSA